MRRIKTAGSAVCVAAALLLISCLLQTAECLRLRKTERRAAQREPGPRTDAGVQEGQIIFGEISEKVTDNKSKTTSNASADDESAYQADFPGWYKVNMEDPASKDKWKQMATSLYCFGDHMKFRSLGPGASQFEVEQANKQSLPLSMVPQKCGYNMLGNSLAFVLTVPYSGCHMRHQGGGYKLPLRWKGHPLSLLCPKRAANFLSNLFHNWAHKHLWPRRHYWPQMHHLHVVPPVSPQDPQVPNFPPVWPQNPQIQVLPPNLPQPQDPQVPNFPPLWPQNPQIQVLPPNLPQPQDPQVPNFPPVWPQNPQIQVLPPNRPQPHDVQIQSFPPVWPQNSQIQVLPPNRPQPHNVQIQSFPPVWPQNPQIQILPPYFQDPQVQSLPPFNAAPQDPPIQVLSPNLPQPQDPQVQVLPPAQDQNKIQFPSLFYDLPQVPPQSPQVNVPPPLYNLPQGNFFPYPFFPYFYGVAPDAEKFSKYPPHSHLQFSLGQTSVAAPETTAAPKVKLTQDSFFSHFPMSYGHHLSELAPEAQYPEVKTTAPPTTTTQTPKNVPLQFYVPDNLQFFPYERMPFSQMYPYLLG